MNKIKSQKGITLIALIITIVVLLILAVVAIRAVQGDGIITKAKEAKNEYGSSEIEEELKMLQYEDKIITETGGESKLLENIRAKEWCVDATQNLNGMIVIRTNQKKYIISATGEISERELVPVKTLSFTGKNNETVTISYEEGMSWREWCDSEYNNNPKYVFYVKGGWVYDQNGYKLGTSGSAPKYAIADDLVGAVDGYSYMAPGRY